MFISDKFLFKQNCLLCKQSSNDIICNYCFDNLLKHLNFEKQEINLGQEYDYYHLLKYSAEVKYLLQKFKFQKDLLSGNIYYPNKLNNIFERSNIIKKNSYWSSSDNERSNNKFWS
ncbi:hypothetical protein fh0823_16440 [Francisella halioticida]|uniref:Amidophosphoribosyltransferase n=1 Tax=Francisella halioticida TaxID=549298 RepID=A0ABN5AYI9_9GAMM|nr:hypothetical protein [Francisella halioticida]ASG68600.1 hypothetical protein CDV26_09525 [Francisella halioticida]BCD91505.1 hypothetical protein fh0823_16440 [Francisella halioticida]